MKCGHCKKDVRFGLFYHDGGGTLRYACLPCGRALGPKLTADFISEGLRRVADRIAAGGITAR